MNWKGRLWAALGAAVGASCWEPAPPAPAGPPRRLVSLIPSHTETLLALGQGEKIVGISSFCPEVPGAARLGDLATPAIESIARLAPDLVFTVLGSDSPLARRLGDVGIRVVSRDPQSLEEVIETVEAIAAETGVPEEGARLAASLRRRLVALRERSALRPPGPRVYVEFQASPPWTAGPGSFVHDALVAVGARNCFADLGAPYAPVSAEEIVRRDPEVVISLDAKRADLVARPAWDGITAVRRGAILDDLGPEALAHGSPRLFDGVERLERLLHPSASLPPVEVR